MMVTFDVENQKGIAASAAKQCEPFARRLAELPLARLAPGDKGQARESLIAMINDERRRLQEAMGVLRSIAEADLAEAPARFAFETGPEGDRYRRYELTNERLALQSYDRFLRTRNFVVTGRFDLIDVDLQEPIGAAPFQTQAPSAIEPAEGASARTVEIGERDPFESHVAIAAIDGWMATARSPQGEMGCDDESFLRNEATLPSGNAPNEPTEPENDATNEPNRAAAGEGSKGVGSCASAVGGGHAYLEVEDQTTTVDEQFWKEVEARKQIRAERLRKLNEESRMEAEAVRAARYSPHRRVANKNGKPGGQRAARKTWPEHRSHCENVGDSGTDLEQLLEAASGPIERAGPISF
jgi:hypothetical protein